MNREVFSKSVNAVRDGINAKLDYSTPYYGRKDTVRNMVTDMDNFPYVRFFRGKYDSEYPIVFNREAGWRVVQQQCYQGALGYKEPPYPNFCFEAPCSTVYPCYPDYLQKNSDKFALDVQLNKLCVMKSP